MKTKSRKSEGGGRTRSTSTTDSCVSREETETSSSMDKGALVSTESESGNAKEKPTKDKEYACPDCDNKYQSKEDLDIHVAADHHQKPSISSSCDICKKRTEEHPHWLCRNCQKCFPTDPSYANHIIRHHRLEEIFICPICQGSIKNRHYVESHMKSHLGRKPHICEVCHKGLGTNTMLLEHTVTVHATEPPKYACEICDKRFHTPVRAKRHQRVHSEDRPYKCDICGEKFKFKQILKSHMHTHSDTRSFKCELCDKSYKSANSLQYHKKGHQKEKKYECPQCGLRFLRSRSLTLHMTIHSGEKPHKCNICFKSFRQRTTYKTHMRIHSGEMPYECEVCNKRFRQRGSMKSHIQVHSGQTFKCYVCDNVYSSSRSRDSHYRVVHVNAKEHKCHVCGKHFNQMKKLTIHMVIHTGLKPYKCKTCGRAFTQKNNLKSHMKLHIGEAAKTYRCAICNWGFYQSSNLNKHMKVHTEVRCKVSNCKKGFPSEEELAKHFETHTELQGREFKCSHCIWSFKRKYALKKHLYVAHKIGMEMPGYEYSKCKSKSNVSNPTSTTSSSGNKASANNKEQTDEEENQTIRRSSRNREKSTKTGTKDDQDNDNSTESQRNNKGEGQKTQTPKTRTEKDETGKADRKMSGRSKAKDDSTERKISKKSSVESVTSTSSSSKKNKKISDKKGQATSTTNSHEKSTTKKPSSRKHSNRAECPSNDSNDNKNRDRNTREIQGDLHHSSVSVTLGNKDVLPRADDFSQSDKSPSKNDSEQGNQQHCSESIYVDTPEIRNISPLECTNSIIKSKGTSTDNIHGGQLESDGPESRLLKALEDVVLPDEKDFPEETSSNPSGYDVASDTSGVHLSKVPVQHETKENQNEKPKSKTVEEKERNLDYEYKGNDSDATEKSATSSKTGTSRDNIFDLLTVSSETPVISSGSDNITDEQDDDTSVFSFESIESLDNHDNTVCTREKDELPEQNNDEPIVISEEMENQDEMEGVANENTDEAEQDLSDIGDSEQCSNTSDKDKDTDQVFPSTSKESDSETTIKPFRLNMPPSKSTAKSKTNYNIRPSTPNKQLTPQQMDLLNQVVKRMHNFPKVLITKEYDCSNLLQEPNSGTKPYMRITVTEDTTNVQEVSQSSEDNNYTLESPESPKSPAPPDSPVSNYSTFATSFYSSIFGDDDDDMPTIRPSLSAKSKIKLQSRRLTNNSISSEIDGSSTIDYPPLTVVTTPTAFTNNSDEDTNISNYSASTSDISPGYKSTSRKPTRNKTKASTSTPHSANVEPDGSDKSTNKDKAEKKAKQPALKVTHTPDRKITCKLCGLKTTAGNPHQSCPTCKICFRHLSQLRKHVISKHECGEGWKCPVCHNQLKERLNIEDHLKTHTNIRCYFCEFCTKSYRTPKALKTHIRESHTNKEGPATMKCPQCDAMFHTEKQVKRHEQGVHSDARPFKCDFCDVVFKNMTHVKRHVRLVHERMDRFKCRRCNIRFKDKATYRQHWERNHDGEKRFACKICDKSFKRRDVLLMHQRTHTGEKPFDCNICGKGFCQKPSLGVHMKRHAEDYPYQCRICHLRYKTSQERDKHRATHEQTVVYTCKVCYKDFDSKHSLHAHTRVHTDRQHKCNVCGMRFSEQAELDHHEKTHDEKPLLHGESTEKERTTDESLLIPDETQNSRNVTGKSREKSNIKKTTPISAPVIEDSQTEQTSSTERSSIRPDARKRKHGKDTSSTNKHKEKRAISDVDVNSSEDTEVKYSPSTLERTSAERSVKDNAAKGLPISSSTKDLTNPSKSCTETLMNEKEIKQEINEDNENDDVYSLMEMDTEEVDEDSADTRSIDIEENRSKLAEEHAVSNLSNSENRDQTSSDLHHSRKESHSEQADKMETNHGLSGNVAHNERYGPKNAESKDESVVVSKNTNTNDSESKNESGSRTEDLKSCLETKIIEKPVTDTEMEETSIQNATEETSIQNAIVSKDVNVPNEHIHSKTEDEKISSDSQTVKTDTEKTTTSQAYVYSPGQDDQQDRAVETNVSVRSKTPETDNIHDESSIHGIPGTAEENPSSENKQKRVRFIENEDNTEIENQNKQRRKQQTPTKRVKSKDTDDRTNLMEAESDEQNSTLEKQSPETKKGQTRHESKNEGRKIERVNEMVKLEEIVRKEACHICGKRYKSREKLINHELSHLGFRCFICRKMFATVSSLTAHRKTHKEGLRPHKCPHCEWGFIHKDMLARHQASAHKT